MGSQLETSQVSYSYYAGVFFGNLSVINSKVTYGENVQVSYNGNFKDQGDSCYNYLLTDKNKNNWLIGASSSYWGTTVTIGSTPNISNSFTFNSIFGNGTIWFENGGSVFNLKGIGINLTVSDTEDSYYLYFQSNNDGSNISVSACSGFNISTNIFIGIKPDQIEGAYSVNYNNDISNPFWVPTFFGNIKNPLNFSILFLIPPTQSNTPLTFTNDFYTGQSPYSNPFYYHNFSTIQALMGMAHSCYLVSSYNPQNQSNTDFLPSSTTQSEATKIFLYGSILGDLV